MARNTSCFISEILDFWRTTFLRIRGLMALSRIYYSAFVRYTLPSSFTAQESCIGCLFNEKMPTIYINLSGDIFFQGFNWILVQIYVKFWHGFRWGELPPPPLGLSHRPCIPNHLFFDMFIVPSFDFVPNVPHRTRLFFNQTNKPICCGSMVQPWSNI